MLAVVAGVALPLVLMVVLVAVETEGQHRGLELLALQTQVAVVEVLAVLEVPALSSSKQINNEGNMATKIYRLYGIDTAMHLLRPGAKWEITNSHFSNWEDPRPCPKWEEVLETMEKIKAFEDSINTVWLPEQIAELTGSPEAQAKAQVAQMVAEQKAA